MLLAGGLQGQQLLLTLQSGYPRWLLNLPTHPLRSRRLLSRTQLTQRLLTRGHALLTQRLPIPSRTATPEATTSPAADSEAPELETTASKVTESEANRSESVHLAAATTADSAPPCSLTDC
jgi:hypothetical protein